MQTIEPTSLNLTHLNDVRGQVAAERARVTTAVAPHGRAYGDALREFVGDDDDGALGDARFHLLDHDWMETPARRNVLLPSGRVLVQVYHRDSVQLTLYPNRDGYRLVEGRAGVVTISGGGAEPMSDDDAGDLMAVAERPGDTDLT